MPAVVAGLFAMAHLRPFQCSNCASLPRADSSMEPAAQTSALEMAASPDRWPVTTVGVGTMLHAAPSQCSASGWSLPREFSADPTAHTSLAETVRDRYSPQWHQGWRPPSTGRPAPE